MEIKIGCVLFGMMEGVVVSIYCNVEEIIVVSLLGIVF